MLFMTTTVIADVATVKVTTTTFLFSEPSLTANTIGTLLKNQELEYLDEADDWYKVRVTDGKEGYIRKIHSKLFIDASIFQSLDNLDTSISFSEIVNSRGVFFSTEYINNRIFDTERQYALVSDSIEYEKQTLRLYLYKLTLLDTNKITFAVECHFFNKKDSFSTEILIDYDEFNTIIKALVLIEEYMETYSKEKYPSWYSINYISKNGISFKGDTSLQTQELKISFDEEHSIRIDDIKDVKKVLNYFKNIENMVAYQYRELLKKPNN